MLKEKHELSSLDVFVRVKQLELKRGRQPSGAVVSAVAAQHGLGPRGHFCVEFTGSPLCSCTVLGRFSQITRVGDDRQIRMSIQPRQNPRRCTQRGAGVQSRTLLLWGKGGGHIRESTTSLWFRHLASSCSEMTFSIPCNSVVCIYNNTSDF